MPVFALAFGSFGDFVTVIHLCLRLRAQLDDAAGASAQMRELVADVDVFRRAVEQIQETVLRREHELQPAVVNGVRHSLMVVKDVLYAIQRKLSAQETKITRAEGEAAWRRLWSIAAWSFLGGQQEVEALRARLRDHVAAMQTFLALSQSHDQGAVFERLNDQRTTLENLVQAVQSIHLRVQADTPTFHFRDEQTGEFYLPCARTSIQRLKDLHEVLIKMWDWERPPDYDFAPLQQYLDAECSGKCVQRTIWLPAFKSFPLGLDCLFFESDFGQWQVLVAASPYRKHGLRIAAEDYEVIQLVITPLLQRRDRPVTPCDCDGQSCRNCRRYATNVAPRLLQSYNTAASLLFSCFGERVKSRTRPITMLQVASLLHWVKNTSAVESVLIPKLREFAAIKSLNRIGHQWYQTLNLISELGHDPHDRAVDTDIMIEIEYDGRQIQPYRKTSL